MLRTRRSRYIFGHIIVLFVCLQVFGALGAGQGYRWWWDDETKVYGWEAYWAVQLFVVLMFFTIYGVGWTMYTVIRRYHIWAERGEK